MITKEELRSIPFLYRQIERDREQSMWLRAKAVSLQSTLADHERENTPGGRTPARDKVQTSPENNFGKYIDEAVDLDKEIEQKQIKLLELQKRAGKLINTVEDPLTKKILKYRYLKCYTWEETAELLGYDMRHLQRLEFDAICLLDP